MKQQYEQPEVEVISFEVVDTITESLGENEVPPY